MPSLITIPFYSLLNYFYCNAAVFNVFTMQVTSIQSELREQILKTLKYFHIFRHPLFIGDIYTFLGEKTDLKQLKQMLDEMILDKTIYTYENAYMITDNPDFVPKRQKGAEMAQQLLKKAVKSAAIISSFPFVKGVCISGSLSKGYADEKSDIDYFIITQKNRLWICRTLLHFYKKFTFITGKEHSFCMNYFLDESHLALEEKNIFTATELTTLYPVYGHAFYKEFITKNINWLSPQFPNIISFYKEGNIVHERSGVFKKVSQAILNVSFPQQLNKFFMKLTDTMWKYKWQKRGYPMQDYDLAMKTKIYVSKNHPANYQKKVLNKIEVPIRAVFEIS